jgi:RNA polymerase sigma-70 factor (ECF subfamily)
MFAKSFPLSSKTSAQVEENERYLVERARQGDASAFGDLYLHYLDDLYRYVYYRVSDERDAEDLTEQTFLRAWQGLAGFRGKVPFAAWIYRIAHNVVIDHYRRRKEVVPLEDNGNLIQLEASLEQQLLNQDEAERLASVIRRLSPLHQHVLVLRFVNGYSVAEVARILERSAGTVRVLQHRALKAAHAFLTAAEIKDA